MAFRSSSRSATSEEQRAARQHTWSLWRLPTSKVRPDSLAINYICPPPIVWQSLTAPVLRNIQGKQKNEVFVVNNKERKAATTSETHTRIFLQTRHHIWGFWVLRVPKTISSHCGSRRSFASSLRSSIFNARLKCGSLTAGDASYSP